MGAMGGYGGNGGLWGQWGGYGGTRGNGTEWEGSGTYWAVLGHTGLYWDSTGLYWVARGRATGALGCTGLYWEGSGACWSSEDSLEDKESSACRGRHPIMPTIMAGKMEMVFPAMYIMKRFIGICFSGPSATSQQRCGETGRDGERKEPRTGQRIQTGSRTFSTRMRSLS